MDIEHLRILLSVPQNMWNAPLDAYPVELQKRLLTLLDWKLVEKRDNRFHVAPRGEVFIKRLLDTPFPVEKTTWVFPDRMRAAAEDRPGEFDA